VKIVDWHCNFYEGEKLDGNIYENEDFFLFFFLGLLENRGMCGILD
jgi:hypothetical protein